MAELVIHGVTQGGKPRRYRLLNPPEGMECGGELVVVQSEEGETQGVATFWPNHQVASPEPKPVSAGAYWFWTFAIGLCGGELVYRLAHLFY